MFRGMKAWKHQQYQYFDFWTCITHIVRIHQTEEWHLSSWKYAK